MDLETQAISIKSRKEFIAFVRYLQLDLANYSSQWENDTLPGFLEALSAWTEDMDGYFAAKSKAPPESPTWSLFAQMLLAAKYYE